MNGGWALSVFTMGFRKQIAYRADFWIYVAGVMFGSLGVAYFLWSSIFAWQGVERIGGFTLHSMILYYTLVPLFSRIGIRTDRGDSSDEIYTGALSRYLLYPIPFFVYKYVEYFANVVVVLIQFGLIVGAFVALIGIPDEVKMTFGTVWAGIGIAVLGGFVYFCLQMSLEAVAFWQDSVWSLLGMLRMATHFLSGVVFPVTFFPEAMQRILGYLPFPYLVSLPIRTAFGQASGAEIAHGILMLGIWGVIAYAIMAYVWARGLKTFSGVGQ